MSMQYATAQGLTIPTYSSEDSKTPTTPVNPVVTISKDGAALVAAAGTVTVIADYGVHVAFTAADMTAAAIAVKVTSDNCDPVALSLVTEAGYTAAKAAFIDAAISSRSTLTAQQVWEYSTRTLSSFGTLAASVAAAVWGVAVRTITGGALTTAPPTKEQIATQVDTTLTAAHGSGAWVGAAGSGERFLTVTVVDGDGAPVADACVSLTNAAQTATLAGPLSTDADGEAVFYRDDAETGLAVVRSTGVQSGGSTAYTVSGATPVTVTVTEIPVPAPAAAGYCMVSAYAITQSADVAAAGTFRLLRKVSPAAITAGGVTVGVYKGADSVAFANGVASLELLQGAVVELQVDLPGEQRRATVTIPAAASANFDTLAGTVVA